MATSSFQFVDFGKGLDLYTRDIKIKENEAAIATNVWSVGKNSLKKRPGYKLMAEVAGAGQVDGIGTYYNASVRELLVMAGGKLYKIESGTATQIGSTTWTSGLKTDFCQAGGKLYIQNGTDALREYNGTTITDTTNGKAGKACIFYKGSLWTFGNSANLTQLFRSGTDTSLGDFTYNVTTNPLATSVYVGKNDGQNITGLFKHQDYLYITKENSIWSVSQAIDESGTISLELIDSSRGCVSHQTIDSVDNDIFFFNDVGMFAFGYEPNITNQIRSNIVSLRVDPEIKTIQKDRLDDIAGIYYDNHYYLSYTSGGASANDTILNYDRQRLGWWKWNIGANCFSEYKGDDGYSRLYFGSSTDGKVYYFDETAKDDAGTAISSKWKSASFSFKDEVQQKFFHSLVLIFGKMSSDVTINVYIDGVLFTSVPGTFGRTGSGGIGTGAIGTKKIGVEKGSGTVADLGGGEKVHIPLNTMGATMQIEITDTSLTKSWELSTINGIMRPINKLYIKI